MKCSCDIELIDVENTKCNFYNKKHVIAIIDHKCSECNRVIKQDEDYELVHGSWNGYVGTYHTCSDCLNLRYIFFTRVYCYEQLWDIFENYLHDWGYQIPEDCMIKLSKRNFDKICDMIEEGWDWLEWLKMIEED